jgi:hypothetical protein
MHTNVRSMFARMPRYALAASGIRSAPQISATGQNGSSQHVLLLFVSSSRIISEQTSAQIRLARSSSKTAVARVVDARCD